MFGSEGLFCFDMEGRQLWHKDLGKLHAGPHDMRTLQWGFASSPVPHEGKVVVQADTLTEQFLVVFDVADGRELWRQPRKEIGGYDFKTGRVLWWLSEGGDVPVASPIRAGDCVILTSGHGKYRPMRAVRLDATGDITPQDISTTNNAVVWCHPRKGNYLQTPIVVGGLLWGCSNDGIVTCFEARTGAVKYEERIGGGGQGFTASPVAAGGSLLYRRARRCFCDSGPGEIQRAGDKQAGGHLPATPAISDGTLFFRTTEKVLAVGFKK